MSEINVDFINAALALAGRLDLSPFAMLNAWGPWFPLASSDDGEKFAEEMEEAIEDGDVIKFCTNANLALEKFNIDEFRWRHHQNQEIVLENGEEIIRMDPTLRTFKHYKKGKKKEYKVTCI